MDANERARRYRARKRGEDVPKEKPGPKKGYMQSPEHIENRKQWGADHPAWKGNEASERAGRSRAIRRYPAASCRVCGEPGERHHIDGNTLNNEPENIDMLCRRCHMREDGRLERIREQARRQQPKASAARWR